MRSIRRLPFVGKMGTSALLCAFVGALTINPGEAQAGDGSTIVMELLPVADTTLFEEGDLSNGGGERMFVGRIANGALRRALVKFDFSTIPADGVIEDAVLTMNMSRTISPTLVVGLHRISTDWGEGTVDAPGQEGAGAPAEEGDATWTDRYFPTVPWDNVGGDFEATASASTPVFSALGPYQWQSQGVLDDIDLWRNNPTQNHGWLLASSENPTLGTAKRFDTREHVTGANRPRLALTVRLPPPPPARPIPGNSPAGLMALVLALGLLGFAAIRRQRRFH